MPADCRGVPRLDHDEGEEASIWGPATLAPRDTTARVSAPNGSLAVDSATLLAVTSDRELRRSIERIARLNLIDVIFASEPGHALSSAFLRRPDAVVVEYGPAGLEVARGLRGLLGTRLPCSFVADGGSFRARVDAAEAGGTLFLTRPLDPEVLTLAIRQMVASGEGAAHKGLVVGAADEPALRREMARRGLVVLHAGVEDCVEAFRSAAPDVVVLAASRDSRARDLCRAIRTSAEWQDVPIVVVGGAPHDRFDLLAAGADDVLLEGVSAGSVAALAGVRAQRARRLRERADADALTGLMRRRSFLEALSRSLAACSRGARSLAVVLCDLDHFKEINDSYGHDSGDQVLAAFGRLLSKSFRAQDLRGRWGGEEFILAFPGETAESVARPVAAMFEELAHLSFVIGEKGPFSVTCSAGASTAPSDGASIDLLLKAADRRLYVAKRNGRARVVASG